MNAKCFFFPLFGHLIGLPARVNWMLMIVHRAFRIVILDFDGMVSFSDASLIVSV